MDKYTDPQWDRTALITIDTQRDLLDGQPFEVPGTLAVLPQIHMLLEAFRRAEKPILHIVRLYLADGTNAEISRRSVIERGAQFLMAGTPGCQIATQLLPQSDIQLDTDLLLDGGTQLIGPHESVMFKPRWGAFYQTQLDVFLRDREVSTIVFCGCNFPNCPRTSIYEASERDFRVVLAEDAISGLYDRGRNELDNIGVTLLDAKHISKLISEETFSHPIGK